MYSHAKELERTTLENGIGVGVEPSSDYEEI
jgi:hypothetical protein